MADVVLMRQTVGSTMGVKASGGIRTLADAEKMIAAGATRIGCSSGVMITNDSLGCGMAVSQGGSGNTRY